MSNTQKNGLNGRMNLVRTEKGIFQCVTFGLLVCIACVSTFLGIILPMSIGHMHRTDTSELIYVNQGDTIPLVFLTKNRALQRKLAAQYTDFETRYYVPRKSRVNPMDYNFLFDRGSQVCGNNPPYLLIVVPSIPKHFARRDAIRKTYGSFAENSLYASELPPRLNATLKLVFVLGNAKDEVTTSMLQHEQNTFKDLIQGDFIDTYYNLTVKMSMALKWVTERCKGLTYLLKMDEDVFVNVPHLIEFLKLQHFEENGKIFGKIHDRHPVLRDGRWKVDKKEFPLTHYPTYVAGNSYVISGHIIPRLYSYAEYFPYLSIEDAFVTGCLARIVHAKHVNVHGFTWWYDETPGPCAFYENKRFTGTKVTLSKMYQLWAAYISYEKLCKQNRQEFLSTDMESVFNEDGKDADSSPYGSWF